MKKFVYVILDETGSMSCWQGQACSGANEMIATLPDKGVRVSMVSFNSEVFRTIAVGCKPSNVPKLVPGVNYQPNHLTPLYDTVMRGISDVEDFLSSKKKKRDVMVLIVTDGEENASRETTLEAVRTKIEEKTREGWEFAYVGTGHDVWSAAAGLGISKGSTVTYNPVETRMAMASTGDALRSWTVGCTTKGNLFDGQESLTDGG